MRFLRKWSYYAWSILEMAAGFRNFGKILQLFLSRKQQRLTWLHLRSDNVQMAVRSKMEAWSVKECFLDRFYIRYGSEIGKDWVIVDIGAAIGEFTILSAREAIDGEVFAFEPNEESYALLLQNLEANRIKNVKSYPVGVWSHSGKIQLDISNTEPLQAKSSESKPNSDDGISIHVISLQQILDEIITKEVDLLKMDCEGAEYTVLIEAPKNTLKMIHRIIMEYHDLDEKRNHQIMTEFLEAHGFTVTIHPNPVHHDIGYLFATQ